MEFFSRSPPELLYIYPRYGQHKLTRSCKNMVIASAQKIAEQYAVEHGYTIEHYDFMTVPDMARLYCKDTTGATDVAEVVCYQPMEYNYLIAAYDTNGNQIDMTSKSNALANGGRIQLANNTNLKP